MADEFKGPGDRTARGRALNRRYRRDQKWRLRHPEEAARKDAEAAEERALLCHRLGLPETATNGDLWDAAWGTNPERPMGVFEGKWGMKTQQSPLTENP